MWSIRSSPPPGVSDVGITDSQVGRQPWRPPSPTPCWGRVSQSRLLKAVSSRVLSISTSLWHFRGKKWQEANWHQIDWKTGNQTVVVSMLQWNYPNLGMCSWKKNKWTSKLPKAWQHHLVMFPFLIIQGTFTVFWGDTRSSPYVPVLWKDSSLRYSYCVWLITAALGFLHWVESTSSLKNGCRKKSFLSGHARTPVTDWDWNGHQSDYKHMVRTSKGVATNFLLALIQAYPDWINCRFSK